MISHKLDIKGYILACHLVLVTAQLETQKYVKCSIFHTCKIGWYLKVTELVHGSEASMQHGYEYTYRYRVDTDTEIRHFLKKPNTRIRFSNFL